MPRTAHAGARGPQSTSDAPPTTFGLRLSLSSRVPELDGLRGIAIGLVLASHCLSAPSIPGSGIARIAAIFRLGFTGVDLFFVLSGFLIAGILLDHCKSQSYFRTFYVRRAFRILPLYYSLLILTWLTYRTGLAESARLKAVFDLKTPFWAFFLFVNNWHEAFLGGTTSFLSPAWSLAVEEQFYLCIPLLIFYLGRRRLALVCVGALFLLPISRVFLHSQAANPMAGFMTRSDGLWIGVLLSLGVRTEDFLRAVDRWKNWLRRVFFASLLGAAVVTVRTSALGWLVGSAMGRTTGFFLISAGYGLILVLALSDPDSGLAVFTRNRALRWFGQRCFGLYLLHQPVIHVLSSVVLGVRPSLKTTAGVGCIMAAFAITLLLAEISWRLLERPMLRRGHAFTY